MSPIPSDGLGRIPTVSRTCWATSPNGVPTGMAPTSTALPSTGSARSSGTIASSVVATSSTARPGSARPPAVPRRRISGHASSASALCWPGPSSERPAPRTGGARHRRRNQPRFANRLEWVWAAWLPAAQTSSRRIESRFMMSPRILGSPYIGGAGLDL